MKASIDKEMQLLQTPTSCSRCRHRNPREWSPLSPQPSGKSSSVLFENLRAAGLSFKQKLGELGRWLSWLSACFPAQGPELELLATM